MKTWFVPYMKKHWRGLFLAACFSVAALLCAAGLLFTSGYLISRAALRPENILMIYVPIVGVRTFGIFRAVFQYASRLSGHDTILRILSEMRTRLYKMLEPTAFFFRSKYRTGDVLGILSDDIEHLQDIYLRTVIPGVSALMIYVLWIGLLGYVDVSFAFLTALYLLILLVVFPALSLLWSGRSHERLSRTRHLLYEKLTDAVLGAEDWMMSGRQKSFLSSHEVLESQVMVLERRLHAMRRWRDLISQVVIGVCVISMVYWTGSMAADHRMDRTLIAAFVLAVFTITESLVPVSEAVERYPQYKDAFKRLRTIETGRPADLQEEPPQAWKKTAERIDIRADHLFYRYGEDGRWAIHDVSLNIAQGQRVALIGRSGAGKSTLTHLIYGSLVPERGRVTLNGTPAHRIGSLMPKQISVLNQNPHLFDTSVINNLALGSENASEKEIMNAARLVGLHDLILSLPNGYETQMHETGDIFSGGEQERLALARILLRKAPVVILDEPTVGLDPTTEKELLSTIFRTLAGKTLIWITHHLVGAEKMDQVVFMEDGEIVMEGTHDRLLQTNSRYRRLYQLDVPEHLKQML
ncbi:thiol reductant ABC exporter subunit CydC [Sporolactobacillus sp. KGMB 08714]|uniref:thiol reductant ABC exporter subunit CydC n=1 Tax=Sporolactobacillus sp. KGMB 08714 TaxID=3064704 RepID=UPI002FBD707C